MLLKDPQLASALPKLASEGSIRSGCGTGELMKLVSLAPDHPKVAAYELLVQSATGSGQSILVDEYMLGARRAVELPPSQHAVALLKAVSTR